MNELNRSKSISSTQFLTRVSILSVVAFLIMFVQVPLAFVAPPFIKLDISDVPALIGAFTMGPLAGICIEFFKNLMHLLLKGTTTFGVGELSNFIIGSSFVAFGSMIYKRHRTYKGAVVGLLVGTISMTAVAIVSNYFVVFPLYGEIMGLDGIIQMGTAVTPKINSLWTMMVYAILPFNLIKGLVVSIVTMLAYKKVSHLLNNL